MKFHTNAAAASTKKDLYTVRVFDRALSMGYAVTNLKNTANGVFGYVKEAHSMATPDMVVQVWYGTKKGGKEVARYVNGKPVYAQRARRPAAKKLSLAERLARQDALSRA